MIPSRWYPVWESARLERRPVGFERLGNVIPTMAVES